MNRKLYVEKVLTETLGLDLASMGKGFLDRIVKTLKNESGDPDSEDVKSRPLSPEEERQLIQAAVVPETWFFRDQGPFQYLRTYLGERKKTADRKEKIAVLSSPCSSGEEPFSIAITFMEAGFSPEAFKIDALDISETALRIARRGAYGNGSFRNMDTGRQGRYFRREGGKFHLQDSIIASVRFSCANLLRKEPASPLLEYDLIFCRNLLIYLHKRARETVFSRIDQLLRPGGVLVAGHTEALFWQSRGYLPVNFPRAFTLIKPDSSRPGRAVMPEQKRGAGADGVSLKGMADLRQSVTTGAEDLGQGGFAAAKGQAIGAMVSRKEAMGGATASVTGKAGEEINEQGFLLGQARNLADRGDLQAALIACRAYLRNERPCAEVYSLMGLIHDAGDRSGDAEDCYRRALYLDPHHVETLIHAALLYERRHETGKASLYRERAERAQKIKST